MAKVSRRLGRLGVDYTDETGRRRWKTFRSEEEAQIYLGEQLIKGGKPLAGDPGITLTEYAPRWLAVAAVRVRPTSLVRYRRIVRRQILPGLGLDPMRLITQARIRDWLAHLMTAPGAPRGRARKETTVPKPTPPLGKSSAAQVLDVLHQIMQQAEDDGIVRENPARGLAKKLRLTAQAIGREIRAMTPEQLAAFLAAAEEDSRFRLIFRTLALTGMRLGEAFGLRHEDVDATGKRLRVERQVREDGAIAEPKSLRSRRHVEVGDALLTQLIGVPNTQPWLTVEDWPDEGPTMEQAVAARNALRYSMRAILRTAHLPAHFTPHSFRHTFASIHLSRGQPLVWVSDQLGHETVAITADLYGRWLRSTRAGAANDLESLVRKP